MHATHALERLDVHVNEAVELALTATLLGGLGVVGKAGTGIVQRVHEHEGRGASKTTRGHVAHNPQEVAILVLHAVSIMVITWDRSHLLEVDEVLEVILEGEVQRLGGEVPDHVGKVSTPQGAKALIGNDAPVIISISI
jgi:hypothetical protein